MTCLRQRPDQSRWFWRRPSSPGVDEITGGWAPSDRGGWLMEHIRSRQSAKIVGSRQAYGAAAKRRVFGTAHRHDRGPSEVLIIASKNGSRWIAADLLAQAEHDEWRNHLITETRVSPARRDSSRAPIGWSRTKKDAAASWRDFGAIISSPIAGSIALANQLAPEHLEIMTANAEDLGERSICGRYFSGRYTPRGLGRLCGRFQPCVANRAFGAVFLRSQHARFPERTSI